MRLEPFKNPWLKRRRQENFKRKLLFLTGRWCYDWEQTTWGRATERSGAEGENGSMQWMMAGNVAILALFCFYLAHKLYALLGAGRGRKLNKLLFASLYALAAILCVGAFFWKRSADLVPWLSGLCSILSAFYIGMMIYGLLLFGLTDIARLLVRLFRKWFRENPDPSPQSAS